MLSAVLSDSYLCTLFGW